MAKSSTGALQLPLWAPDSAWRPPEMSELPTSWRGIARIAVDCETNDPYLRELGIGVRRPCSVGGSGMVGLSFAIEDGPKFYLPFRHEGGDNLPEKAVLAYLRQNLGEFDGELVGANLSYDLDYMWAEGMLTPNVKRYRDIQIADPLIYELQQSYSLDNISKRHGLPGKSEDLLRKAAQAFGLDPKSDMWRLPARYVGLYAEDDADLPLRVLRKQERQIDDKGIWNIYNLESDVLPVLVRMRQRGVRVDEIQLAKVEEWALEQESTSLRRVFADTGVKIAVGDVWKAGAIAPALEYIGVGLTKTSKGQPSIDKDLLSSINHPVATALAWARKTNKLRTTFGASIRKYMVKGRIHCTFNQIARETEAGGQKGARFGRLSATDPNLQQQPSREEFAAMWRSIYLPEEGALWACNDYSQQEPRWTTHFAGELDLPGARETCQRYTDDPTLDNHQFMADLTGLPRKFAKNIYLGLCYGEGGAKLCRELDLPTRWAVATGRGRGRVVKYFPAQEAALEYRSTLESTDFYLWEAAGEEGQNILDTFDSRAPFIRRLAKAAEKRAKQRGFIETKEGRRLHFPQRKDGSYDWTHKALNRLIQGTSADQMKLAMIEIDRAGHWMMLQVHDETDNSVGDRAEAERIGEIMSDIIVARVPFKVDVELGANWGELE